MSNQDDLSDIVRDCMAMFDENINILSDVCNSLGSESEDDLTLVSDKTELIDMVHEVADSVRIKKAESSFMQRYVKQDS
jgi:hypothetical protein